MKQDMLQCDSEEGKASEDISPLAFILGDGPLGNLKNEG